AAQRLPFNGPQRRFDGDDCACFLRHVHDSVESTVNAAGMSSKQVLEARIPSRSVGMIREFLRGKSATAGEPQAAQKDQEGGQSTRERFRLSQEGSRLLGSGSAPEPFLIQIQKMQSHGADLHVLVVGVFCTWRGGNTAYGQRAEIVTRCLAAVGF